MSWGEPHWFNLLVSPIQENLVYIAPPGAPKWKLPGEKTQRVMDGYAYWSGTSFAAPQVAAMIAEVLNGTTVAAAGALDAYTVSPGFFSANSSGSGVAAGR